MTGVDVACPVCGDTVPVTFAVAMTVGGQPALVEQWATFLAHMATHEPEPDQL